MVTNRLSPCVNTGNASADGSSDPAPGRSPIEPLLLALLRMIAVRAHWSRPRPTAVALEYCTTRNAETDRQNHANAARITWRDRSHPIGAVRARTASGKTVPKRA